VRIGIIGCGVAGQAAAITLARDGHAVTVMERFNAANPIGAGLLLQPSGLSVLDRLGLRGKATAWGAPVERLFGRTVRGRTVMDLRYAKVADGTYGLGIHRAALHNVLHQELLNSRVELLLGFEATSLSSSNASPVVQSRGGRSEGPFDLVVLCAGAHDTLRHSLGLNVTDPVYPWGAFWATCADRSDLFQRELRQVYDGAKIMIGILPIGRAPGASFAGNHVAFFWSLPCAELDAQKLAGLDALKQRVLRVWPDTKPIVDEISSFDQFSFATYRDVRMRPWRKDRVIAIGDAAHGTSPQLGQGANLALIDAITLASALRTSNDVDTALKNYERLRRPQIRYYQWMSRALTPVFQSNSRAIGWTRDAFLGPVSHFPIVSHVMRTALSGVRKLPFGVWKLPN